MVKSSPQHKKKDLSFIKHDPVFPSNAVKFCLDYAGLTLGKIEAIVF
nr:hypothetical protein [uncultured Emticicia sp.]